MGNKIKDMNRQVKKINDEYDSKDEESRQVTFNIAGVKDEMDELEKKRPPGNISDNKQFIEDFNRKVAELNRRNSMLIDRLGILTQQGLELERKMQMLEDEITGGKNYLIGLIRPYASCAWQLQDNTSLEAIEQCWQTYINNNSVDQSLLKKIPLEKLPERGAPVLMELIRQEQLNKIKIAETPKIIIDDEPPKKPNPSQPSTKIINVNEEPPQKGIMMQTKEKVTNYIKMSKEFINPQKNRVRKTGSEMTGTRG